MSHNPGKRLFHQVLSTYIYIYIPQFAISFSCFLSLFRCLSFILTLYILPSLYLFLSLTLSLNPSLFIYLSQLSLFLFIYAPLLPFYLFISPIFFSLSSQHYLCLSITTSLVSISPTDTITLSQFTQSVRMYVHCTVHCSWFHYTPWRTNVRLITYWFPSPGSYILLFHTGNFFIVTNICPFIFPLHKVLRFLFG